MRARTLFIFIATVLSLTACKKDEVRQVIKKPYANGVLLLSNSSKETNGPSELSFIDEQGKLTLNIFSTINTGKTLSAAATSITHFNNRYYITSIDGPNHLTVIDEQTLKLDYTITQSGIAKVAYFTTTDGKTGYVNVTDKRKAGLYAVDLSAKTITGTSIPDSKDVPLIPISTVNNSVVTGAGKRLVKVDNNQLQTLYTYKENVAGVVKTAGKTVWIGVQGFTNKPKFIKLDQTLIAVDSVELDNNNFKLPANGILTASGTDEFIYWQETSLGVLCRFNTLTKVAEKLIDHPTAGIMYATAWKIDPRNGDIYIADTPDLFSGDLYSHLYIFDKNGKSKRVIKNVGYAVSDIIFTN
ncbi:hypothetical protein KTO58_07785 [Chitinophaga pendula]|uniref:DUF5074 domain-containing protein n=1 Tax=Chitinophaga TaxID=79328 RepID=UPI000BAF389C|nr:MULTISPECIES: DUF5074 domain-containing protein [Chitinophaga]ASZ13305.1 hypothetical protein CK934_21250 [Chitinophaga sp. MD30]UCJ09071.1 hypothetical protein KTO58_07785 [Chitinophaga pendula]